MVANPVSLRTFLEWMSKNKNRTWYLPSWGERPMSEKSFKYISPHIDTRTMTVYAAEIWGMGDKKFVHIQDGNEKQTILDVLEEKLGWDKDTVHST